VNRKASKISLVELSPGEAFKNALLYIIDTFDLCFVVAVDTVVIAYHITLFCVFYYTQSYKVNSVVISTFGIESFNLKPSQISTYFRLC